MGLESCVVLFYIIYSHLLLWISFRKNYVVVHWAIIDVVLVLMTRDSLAHNVNVKKCLCEINENET